MRKNFYLGLKARVEAGQYTMEEIVAELDKRLGQGWITDAEYAELRLLAETKIDQNYDGNKHPTNYDLEQDVLILSTEASVLELFEMVMGTVAVQTATQQARIEATFSAMTRSAIGDTYLRHVLLGIRTFSSVHDTKKQEVADKLIAMNRCDLIDVPEYHQAHDGCLHGNETTPQVQ